MSNLTRQLKLMIGSSKMKEKDKNIFYSDSKKEFVPRELTKSELKAKNRKKMAEKSKRRNRGL